MEREVCEIGACCGTNEAEVSDILTSTLVLPSNTSIGQLNRLSPLAPLISFSTVMIPSIILILSLTEI